MLLIVAAIAFLAALLFVLYARRRRHTRDLGWMSEQWVAEHRSSRRL
jgi:hypothetical protein